MESVRLIKHLQSQIHDLRQQTKVAEEKASRMMGRMNEIVQSQRINYHALFLQSPVPTALLSTDGQFVDANSQFCTYVSKSHSFLPTPFSHLSLHYGICSC